MMTGILHHLIEHFAYRLIEYSIHHLLPLRFTLSLHTSSEVDMVLQRKGVPLSSCNLWHARMGLS